MKVNIDKFYPKLKTMFEAQGFEVGILEAGKHRPALDKEAGLKSFAGVQARKVGAGSDGSMQDLGGKLQDRYFWLSRPFRDGNEKQKEIINFAKNYISEIQKTKINNNRLRNLVQAIVRNPILRSDYGMNEPVTALQKGFDHLMIDTAQFFNAIKAKVVKNV